MSGDGLADRTAIAAALAAVRGTADAPAPDRLDVRRLGGGCIAEVRHVRWDGGEAVAKIEPAGRHDRLAAEADGLAALMATGAVRVPNVLGQATSQGRAVLLLEWLPPAVPDELAWERFGRSLAGMHGAGVPGSVHDAASGAPAVAGASSPGYGWPRDIWLGRTPMRAAWRPTWPELLVGVRLEGLLRTARDDGGLAAHESTRVVAALARLERDLPSTPMPALLHGDLWSGNAHATVGRDRSSEVALIDPAIHVGDAWSELGMMECFGGFPERCFASYAEASGGRPADAPLRIAAGRLLHELNHLVMFGAAYRPAVLATARTIGG